MEDHPESNAPAASSPAPATAPVDADVIDDPAPPPPIRVQRPPPRPASYWVKKLLVCNPFYLVSAALLLCGLYLVSTDDHFPGAELAQLAFNFSSLQLYEILLVATAIVLARRRIWYDSNLLIFLENGLILVPFILVSQAALIGQGLAGTLCLAGAAMAALRFAALKRLHAPLHLPWKLLAAGVVLLLVNVALPLIYRTLNETRLGIKSTHGAAYAVNQAAWLLILPALIALANALSRPTQAGDLLPQRRWIPGGLFSFWIAGTAVHLYSLGYVFNFDWEGPFLAPPLWALAWTLYNRQPGFLRDPRLRPALLICPAAITLIAAINSAPRMFLALTGLNLAAYAFLLWRNRSSRSLRHLAFLSLAALTWGFVIWLPIRLPWGMSSGECVLLFGLLYACYWIGLSRNPQLGVLGAVMIGSATNMLVGPYFDGSQLAVQAGVLFLLLHSLLWADEAHPGVKGVRILAGVLWMLHSLHLALMAAPHNVLILSTGAVLILAPCVVLRYARGQWPPRVLPLAATTVLLLHPGIYLITIGQSIPLGLWVVAGSFVLFALGTVLAVRRATWWPVATKVAIVAEGETRQ
jgi:hypothetical protein